MERADRAQTLIREAMEEIGIGILAMSRAMDSTRTTSQSMRDIERARERLRTGVQCLDEALALLAD